jgi:hypothetical protein
MNKQPKQYISATLLDSACAAKTVHRCFTKFSRQQQQAHITQAATNLRPIAASEPTTEVEAGCVHLQRPQPANGGRDVQRLEYISGACNHNRNAADKRGC